MTHAQTAASISEWPARWPSSAAVTLTSAWLDLVYELNELNEASNGMVEIQEKREAWQRMEGESMAELTLAVFITAPKPVAMPQPKRQTDLRGASLLILATLTS